jgi:hypothetical protein
MPADPEIFTGDADRFPRNSGGMQQSPSLTTLRSFATCTGLRGRGRTLKRCRGSFACQAEGRLCMCLSLPVISVAESSVALLARLPSSVSGVVERRSTIVDKSFASAKIVLLPARSVDGAVGPAGQGPDLYYVRNVQLPATGQWLRKLASTVNEELRYRANRAISHGHDPNR